jgi:hypothetical protein
MGSAVAASAFLAPRPPQATNDAHMTAHNTDKRFFFIVVGCVLSFDE